MTFETTRIGIRRLSVALLTAALTCGCASTDSTGPQDRAATAAVQKGAPTETAAAETKAEIKNPESMRCKRISETGSRVKKKVCATNREWAVSEEMAQKATKEYQRGSAIGRAGD